MPLYGHTSSISRSRLVEHWMTQVPWTGPGEFGKVNKSIRDVYGSPSQASEVANPINHIGHYRFSLESRRGRVTGKLANHAAEPRTPACR